MGTKSDSIAVMARESKNERSEWEIKDDMRTLIRAEEIKLDAKRYKQAQAMARRELQAMNAVAAGSKK